MPRYRFPSLSILALVLFGLLALGSAAAWAQHDDLTHPGPPDASPLSPHVDLPDLGTVPWPLDCSSWPETVPAGGYQDSVFGHRILGGDIDFHRGLDLRCDADGDTCCEADDGTVYCDQDQCLGDDEELPGAPVYALVAGEVKTVHGNQSNNNNLVVETVLAADDIRVGDTDCNEMYVWYQHLRTDYADNPNTGLEWAIGDEVPQGALLGWQGKSGANTVHLHLSTRLCENSRADGDPVGTLDPEMNPFQLIGSDNGQAPEILALSTAADGADLLVTVQIETDDPDFDMLQITVYDAINDVSTVRRLGYNSRLGIDVAGNDLDSVLLEPDDLSELIAIAEPDPPVATSGLTLTARFEGLGLGADPNTRVQAKVADVFGNTAIEEVPLFGDGEIGDQVWLDEDGDGVQDAGEPGLAGVTVELYSDAGVLIDTAISDAQGAYGFSELIPGDYRLRFLPPGGYGLTVQTPGFPDLDSDPDPQTWETGTVSLGVGETDTSVDAGLTAACLDATLVSFGSVWRTTGSHSANWYTAGFDDSGWASAQATLGFANSAVFSTITEDGLTSYFRTEFDVADVSLFDTLDLALRRDDGAVVYLNGVEVMRSNLPAGTIAENTRASSSSHAIVTTTLPATHLVPGPNVLAVEVHNRAAGSDQVFDLELSSLVCRPCLGEVVLPAITGTYLDSSDPTDAEGDDDEIKIDGSPERSGLLAWDLSGLPSGVDVLKAEIIVEITNDSSDAYPVYALSRAWNAASATWEQAVGGSPGVDWEADGANGPSDRGAVPIGLARLPEPVPAAGAIVLNPEGRDLVEDWLDGNATHHGLIIHGDPSQSSGGRIASDDSDDKPLLRVVYAATCGG